MASEDSGRPILPAVSSSTIQSHGSMEQALESLSGQVFPSRHRLDDGGKRLELKTLLAEDLMPLEKRDDLIEKISLASYHEHK
jgi:hypothetical protein